MPGTTDRRIYFYRIRIYSPNEQPHTDEARALDPVLLAEQIEQLAFDNGERYQALPTGDDLCVWPQVKHGVVRMRVGIVRRSNLPRLEHVGNVLPLPISEEDGLLEEIHVVFFPTGIVGAEFNFFGPRIGRLAEYVNTKLPNQQKISFDMLVAQDILEQLDHIRRPITLVSMKLRREYSELLRYAGESLPDAFAANKLYLNPETITITLQVDGRSKKHDLGEQAREFLYRLARDERRLREGVDKFVAKARDDRTNKIELFDLLQDKLMAVKKVVRNDERYRGVDSESMYAAIYEAYRERESSLLKAAALSGE